MTVKHLFIVLLIGASLVGLPPMIAIAQAGEETVQPRNPVLNGFASFLIPGLGQYLNGDSDKAWVHFIVAVAIQIAPIHIRYTPPWSEYLKIDLLYFGWVVYSAIDAYETAKRFNEEYGFALYLNNNEIGISYSYQI